jgi:mannose-6-phosphate isomerase-like protein (cupin superfamily)
MNERSYWFFGSRLTFFADAQATDGRYDLIEGWFPAGARTPLHRHNRFLEQLYVLEGEFTVWAGERKMILHAGESATIPIGTDHCIAATGPGPARGLVVASPSGFAHLLSEVATPDTGGPPPTEPPDVALFERLSAEVGDEILGPPGTLPGGAVPGN